MSGGNRGGGGFSRWECQKCGFSDEEITKETLEVCPRCGNKLTKPHGRKEYYETRNQAEVVEKD